MILPIQIVLPGTCPPAAAGKRSERTRRLGTRSEVSLSQALLKCNRRFPTPVRSWAVPGRPFQADGGQLNDEVSFLHAGGRMRPGEIHKDGGDGRFREVVW